MTEMLDTNINIMEMLANLIAIGDFSEGMVLASSLNFVNRE